MRRSVLVSGVLALFVASLALAAVAEARVGGGSSSGSRGSRSFSAPRNPSTPPASPSNPTSPQRNLSSPAQPQRSGGFLGGFGGMLGGFLLGGLIGGLLFGGLGHGFGMGLMDILVIGGLIALAVMFFRRRQPTQPAAAYAGAGSGTEWTPGGQSSWAPAQTSGTEPMTAGTATLDRDLEDFDRGVAAIRMMDPGFTPVRFATHARDMFVRLQSAWSGRDLASIRGELTDELASSLQVDLDRLKAQRRTNRLERVAIESAEPTEAWQETGQDFVTIRFRASALDYTVDDATGAVVEGSQTTPASFEEFWTFSRPVGANPWRLSAIQQPA